MKSHPDSEDHHHISTDIITFTPFIPKTNNGGIHIVLIGASGESEVPRWTGQDWGWILLA
jgi:hypothetical protein